MRVRGRIHRVTYFLKIMKREMSSDFIFAKLRLRKIRKRESSMKTAKIQEDEKILGIRKRWHENCMYLVSVI